MKWLYNDQWYDVSRFTKCKLRFSNICELLSIPEFQHAVNEYQDEFDISDEWIIETENSLRNEFEERRGSAWFIEHKDEVHYALLRFRHARTAYRKLGFDVPRIEKQK